MSVVFEPYSLNWQQDPYPIYRRLRDEAPVHYAPASRVFCISRYADVQRVLKDAQTFSSKIDLRHAGDYGALKRARILFRFLLRMKMWPTTLARARVLVGADGDAHSALRRIVSRGFTPRRIGVWEARIREILVERMAPLATRQSFDLVHEIASPLPVRVITEMLGFEPARMHDLKRWSADITQGLNGSSTDKPLHGNLLNAFVELQAFLRPIVQARRQQPRDDLISTLAETTGDGALSDFEILLFVLLLFIAGNETTTNSLGNAVDALLAHPEQLARVMSDPSLVTGVVEETLRFDSPAQLVVRTALETTEIAGVVIPAGAQVVVLLGSANRDERMFHEPDRFDVTRDTRGHLALGFGPHFCLGYALARLQLKAALEAIVPMLPRLSRLRPEREFLESYVMRGRKRLELKWAPGMRRANPQPAVCKRSNLSLGQGACPRASVPAC